LKQQCVDLRSNPEQDCELLSTSAPIETGGARSDANLPRHRGRVVQDKVEGGDGEALPFWFWLRQVLYGSIGPIDSFAREEDPSRWETAGRRDADALAAVYSAALEQ